MNSSVDAVWRIESSRVIATLVRFTGDVGQAEDLAQEALVAALEQWPEAGMDAHLAFAVAAGGAACGAAGTPAPDLDAVRALLGAVTVTR